MTNELNDVLLSHNSAINNDDLVQKIKPFSTLINKTNDLGNTAIMQYLISVPRDKINIFVLETLITKFSANVNIPNSKNQFPISYLLHGDVQEHDFDILSLLLKYTTEANLLSTSANQSIFLKIMLIPSFYKEPIMDLVIDILKLYDSSDTLVQMFTALLLIHDDAQIRYILDKLPRAYYPRDNIKYRIPSEMSIPACSTGYCPTNLILEQSLLALLDKQDKDKILSLLSVYPVSILNEQTVRTLLNKYPNHIPHNLINVLAQFRNIHYILNQSINPVQIVKDRSEVELKLAQVFHVGDTIVNNYIKTRDIQTANKAFGDNNNIFHFLSLFPSYDDKQLQKIYDLLIQDVGAQGIKYFSEYNILLKTPLTIALLSGNTNFIKFYISNINGELSLLQPVDIMQNTVLHFLARTPLSRDLLDNIVQDLSIDKSYIVSATNLLGQNPSFDAVHDGNLIFLKWFKDKEGNLLAVDDNKNTLWHELAKSQHKTKNALDLYEFLYLHIKQTIHTVNNEGQTPFEYAVKYNNVLIMQLFVEKIGDGLDYTHQDNDGNTISHIMSGFVA